MSTEELLEQRRQKFRAIGAVGFKGISVDNKKKLKMKPSGKILRMKPTSSASPRDIAAHPSSPGHNVAENPAKMREGTEMEMEQVVKSAEVRRKLEQLQLEGRNGSSQESITKLKKEIKDDILSLVKNSASKESAVILRAIGGGLEQFVESAGLIRKMEELTGEMKSGLSKERIAKLKNDIKEGLLGVRETVNLKETAKILIAIRNTKGKKESHSSQKRDTKVERESKGSISALLKKAASIRPDLAEKIAEIDAVIGNENEQAVNSATLRPKMELEREIRTVLNQKRLTKLEEKAEDGILAVMDSSESKEEVEGGLTLEVSTTPEAVGVDGSVGADNGRA
ncbi:hypothetical protein ACLOJK_024497 [Asimina triloba]